MLEKILYQLNEYIKYNKMENSLIQKTSLEAFKTGNFQNIYLDSKTYPILKQQVFKLMREYEKNFPKKYKKPLFW